MILSGDLRDFSLADVLQLLLQQHKSGVLNLTHNKDKAELFVSVGNLTGVRVNGQTADDKVKEMLIETGRVPRKEMEDLQAITQEMNRPLLATLSAKGHLSEETWEEWQQIITEDMVCELFGWLDGQYEFGTGHKDHTTSHLNISTEFACMEGMRRIDEWPRLKEALSDAKRVFKPTGKLFDGDPRTWDYQVFGLVDGRKTMPQISKLVPFGSFRLSECLVNLWQGGFIAPIKGPIEDVGTPVQVDPQSEKDSKTAMVLGIAVLFLFFGTAVRLFSIWMVGAGNQTAVNGYDQHDYYSGISYSLGKDNMEAFLMDHAARMDSLPKTLWPLVQEGILSPREIRNPGNIKPFYRKTSDKTYVLK